MFICKRCLSCKEPHYGGSYGRCEICEKVGDCVDCRPWHYRIKEKE